MRIFAIGLTHFLGIGLILLGGWSFAFLKTLTARLGDKTYLNGETHSLIDIAIFPFIRQFRIADMDWFDENAPEALRA